MSAASKGRKHTPEARAKMREANKGDRKLTKEQRAKMGAARSKPVVVHGKYYASITQAAKAEKVTYDFAKSRLKSSKSEWSEWRYLMP